jgi:hypothetical protein
MEEAMTSDTTGYADTPALSDAKVRELCERLRDAADVIDNEGYELDSEIPAKAADAIEALLAREAALRKDAGRLDYIEKNFHCLGFTLGNTWMTVSLKDKRRFGCMRDAIDALIAELAKGKASE